MDIYDYAMQMEKDGEMFYRQIIMQTEDLGIKKILSMIADEEVKHFTIIQNMKSKIPQQLRETDILNNVKNIFQQMRDSGEEINVDVKQIDLYKQAQEIEQKSRTFYLERAKDAPDDQKPVFAKLADEERKHYVLFENIIQLVSRPDLWLENAEWYHIEKY